MIIKTINKIIPDNENLTFCCSQLRSAYDSCYLKVDGCNKEIGLFLRLMFETGTYNSKSTNSIWFRVCYCPFCGTQIKVNRCCENFTCSCV